MGGLGHIEGRGEIQFENGVDKAGAGRFGLTGRRTARIIHEDVEAAVLACDGVNKGAGGPGVANVDGVTLQIGGKRLGPIAAADCDCAADAGQSECNVLPKAARATGDDRNLA